MRLMDVPFHTQLDLVTSQPRPAHSAVDWPHRSCAVACLTMLLHHFGRPASMEDVLRIGLAGEAFDPTRGWLHSGQVGVLQSFGLTAYRRNWRLLDGHEALYLAGRAWDPTTSAEVDLVKRQLLEEGRWTIGRLLAAGVPVIVSVYRPWGDRTSIGHQVVLTGHEDETVTFHDPAVRTGADSRISADVFFASWKGTAIVALDDPPPGGAGAGPSVPSQINPSTG